MSAAARERDFSCASAEKTRDIAPGHSAHLSLKADVTRERLLRFLSRRIDSNPIKFLATLTNTESIVRTNWLRYVSEFHEESTSTDLSRCYNI